MRKPGPSRLGVPPKGLNTTLVYSCPYSPVKVAYRAPEAASTGQRPLSSMKTMDDSPLLFDPARRSFSVGRGSEGVSVVTPDL